MKILLLGEYSGLHGNLQDGLEAIGHNVTHCGDGDTWKKMPVEIDLTPRFPGILGAVEKRLKAFTFLYFFAKDFDVVQVFTPYHFKMKFFPFFFLMRRLKKRNKKLFTLAASTDPIYWKYGQQKLDYTPFNDNLKWDLGGKTSYYETDEAMNFHLKFLDLVDGIIPCNYDYWVSYEDFDKRKGMIPMPINTSKIEYSKNVLKNNKIILFHGITRYGMKGTYYIEKALKELKDKYSDLIEVQIVSKLAFAEYMKALEDCNVLFDQTNSHSGGMNSLYGLAMGKIVFGGAETYTYKSYGVEECPIFNIKPSIDSIVDQVESLILQKDKIELLGLQSRKYAQNVHSHTVVAKRFIETWSKD